MLGDAAAHCDDHWLFPLLNGLFSQLAWEMVASVSLSPDDKFLEVREGLVFSCSLYKRRVSG